LVTISVSLSVLTKTSKFLGVFGISVLLTVFGPLLSIFSPLLSILLTVLGPLLTVFGESVLLTVIRELTVLGNLLDLTVDVVETVKEEVENILDDVVEVTVGFFLGDQDQLFDLSDGELDVVVEFGSQLVSVGEDVVSGKLVEVHLYFAQFVDYLFDDGINMFVSFQLVDDVLDDLSEMTGMD